MRQSGISFGLMLNSQNYLQFGLNFLVVTILTTGGPRPLLMRYIPLYNERQARRHEVRPGLTGYAQAYGRNSLTWEDKFEKDVYYVDNVGFLLDVKILFKTVAVVLKREGISSETSATMEEFKGSPTPKEELNV